MDRAQGAIEYLLIIAAAILVVAIVILAITGALGGGQDQTTHSNIASNNAFDSLKETSGNYIFLNNKYYLKSKPIVKNINLVYHFDSLNSSVGDFTFSIIGGTTQTDDGLFGTRAYEFDGTTNGAIVSDESFSMNTDDGFSISFWVKGDAYPGTDHYICNNGIVSSRTGNVYYVKGWSISNCIYDHMNQAVFWLDDGVEVPYGEQIANLNSNKIIFDGFWHHIVGTIKTPGMARIYVDGGLEKEIISDGEAFSLDSKLYIGTNQLVGASNSFKGSIDELAIWNRELTGDEVLELHNVALAN